MLHSRRLDQNLLAVERVSFSIVNVKVLEAGGQVAGEDEDGRLMPLKLLGIVVLRVRVLTIDLRIRGSLVGFFVSDAALAGYRDARPEAPVVAPHVILDVIDKPVGLRVDRRDWVHFLTQFGIDHPLPMHLFKVAGN